tara:strand:+ start:4037 stop:5056 length:1020 start_codon:yes stop_codon:yes gene_type:complete
MARGSSPTEEYAYPSDPNRMPIPLYGEQVLCISQVDGTSTASGVSRWYYTSVVNAHGNVNNAILPFMQDKSTGETNYAADPIVKSGIGAPPDQLSFGEQDIVYIQPFQGDINTVDRFGSVLRFSSTHLPTDIASYLKKPFFTGKRKGDPFVALTCGVSEARDGNSMETYYAIEDPEKDSAFIYLSSSQQFNKFKFAQGMVGAGVKMLNVYDRPQVIIGSDRLVFNARKDEILLVAKKDVKIATPAWQTGMDAFFTLMLDLVEEVIEQNKNLQAAHDEIKTVSAAQSVSVHPTGIGFTGVPANQSEFVQSSFTSTINASSTISIRGKIEKIKSALKKMKQ